MPDNANAPGSAATSATSPQADATNGNDTSAILKRLEANDKSTREAAKAAAEARTYSDNLRSLHDRQFQEIRAAIARGNSTDNGEGEVQPAATRSAPSSYDLRREQDFALIKFRQENTDWQDYWEDITAITSDSVKSAPHVRYNPDGTVDFYASLNDVRSAVELTRLRAKKADYDAAQKDQERLKSTSRRDATISGSGASPSEGAIDIAGMSADDMLRKGLLNDHLDPNDLPEALRRKVS